MPYYPTGASTAGHNYETGSYWRRLVSEYTGLTFLQVAELDYIQFLTWRRDAFIWKLSQTEAGQEYLDNAWRMEQTKPDREGLRRKFGKKEGEQDGEQRH